MHKTWSSSKCLRYSPSPLCIINNSQKSYLKYFARKSKPTCSPALVLRQILAFIPYLLRYHYHCLEGEAPRAAQISGELTYEDVLFVSRINNPSVLMSKHNKAVPWAHTPCGVFKEDCATTIQSDLSNWWRWSTHFKEWGASAKFHIVINLN